MNEKTCFRCKKISEDLHSPRLAGGGTSGNMCPECVSICEKESVRSLGADVVEKLTDELMSDGCDAVALVEALSFAIQNQNHYVRKDLRKLIDNLRCALDYKGIK